tara:strand:+ start:76 stop:297 length:222 start_codon:yes stop_codon:yes gene_type:complete
MTKVMYRIVFEVEGGVWGDEKELHGGDVFLTREDAEAWAMCQGMEMNQEVGGLKDHRIVELNVQTDPYYPEED